MTDPYNLNKHLSEQEANEKKWAEAYAYAKDCDDFLQGVLKDRGYDDNIWIDIHQELNKSIPDLQLIGQMILEYRNKELENYAQNKLEES